MQKNTGKNFAETEKNYRARYQKEINEK